VRKPRKPSGPAKIRAKAIKTAKKAIRKKYRK
jgi:hypothetical protein